MSCISLTVWNARQSANVQSRFFKKNTIQIFINDIARSVTCMGPLELTNNKFTKVGYKMFTTAGAIGFYASDTNFK